MEHKTFIVIIVVFFVTGLLVGYVYTGGATKTRTREIGQSGPCDDRCAYAAIDCYLACDATCTAQTQCPAQCGLCPKCLDCVTACGSQCTTLYNNCVIDYCTTTSIYGCIQIAPNLWDCPSS